MMNKLELMDALEKLAAHYRYMSKRERDHIAEIERECEEGYDLTRGDMEYLDMAEYTANIYDSASNKITDILKDA